MIGGIGECGYTSDYEVERDHPNVPKNTDPHDVPQSLGKANATLQRL